MIGLGIEIPFAKGNGGLDVVPQLPLANIPIPLWLRSILNYVAQLGSADAERKHFMDAAFLLDRATFRPSLRAIGFWGPLRPAFGLHISVPLRRSRPWYFTWFNDVT